MAFKEYRKRSLILVPNGIFAKKLNLLLVLIIWNWLAEGMVAGGEGGGGIIKGYCALW